MEEIWKLVENFENYEVSNLSRLRRIKIFINKRRENPLIKETILKPSIRGEYIMVTLISETERKCIPFHRIVAKAFVNNPYNKKYVNHINGIKTDNRVENLEWCTSSENQIHALNTKLKIPCFGETHGQAKLSNEEVRKIRKVYKNEKISQRKLAVIYNVSQCQIHNILVRKLRKDVV